MPFETVNLILDMFLLYDMSNLFRAILTAISQVHDICLNIDRFDLVLLTIQDFMATDFTPDLLINSLVEKISPEELARSRTRHRKEIVDLINTKLTRGFEMQPTHGD